MPDTNTTFTEDRQDLTQQTSDAARKAKDMISEGASKAQEKARELGQAAADKVDEKRGGAADALHGASTAIHEKADNLPGGGKVSEMAHAAADKMDSAANYVQEHDTKEMMADVESLIRRHPAQSLLVAAGVGFLVGRAFRND